jgi:hypothetical protein
VTIKNSANFFTFTSKIATSNIIFYYLHKV